jgi:outer membrane protein, heavy metal efflux system
MKYRMTALAAVALASAGAAQQNGHRVVAPEGGVVAVAAQGSMLTLGDALALASTGQPMIEANEREAVASDEAAVAARSLPDPQLSIGIQDLPVLGRNAFSLTNDDFTMYTIGLMREQVRRSKREADAGKIEAEALVSRKQASAEERHIRRDAMIAWINAVEARAKQRVIKLLISDLMTGRKVIASGIPTGTSAPSLALQADAEIALERSQLAEAESAESHARAELARWIGPAASRPLPDVVPDIAVPLDMVPPIDAHPEVQVALAQQQVAHREIEVAQVDRKPDITWSVSLGLRPKYSQMISAGVSIPLQTNRRNKQDRLISAARLRAGAAALKAEDARRELTSEYQTAVADYRGATAEIARIDQDAVPSLEAAFKSAEARYQGGGGTLDQPFAIARRYEEVAIQSIEAHARRARAAAEILHVHGEGHQ